MEPSSDACPPPSPTLILLYGRVLSLGVDLAAPQQVKFLDDRAGEAMTAPTLVA
jgi:hypothetical protein